MNYKNFKQECEKAFTNNIISKEDVLLLTKIAKAISEEDKGIEMHLDAFVSINSHNIECNCLFVENWQKKIKKAMQIAYFYHKNVWFGYDTCTIVVGSNSISAKAQEIVQKHRDKQIGEMLGEKVKPTCQFAQIIDYIVKLAEKGKYNKCDGIIQYLISHHDSFSFTTEEELLNDLKQVKLGNVEEIAKKYKTDINNIESLLMIRIRCFDALYLFNNNFFFDLCSEDYNIIDELL